MFKTAVPFGRFSKKTPSTIRNSLHEFSIAEFSSAIEMLHAAKRHDPVDIKMTLGFLNHALDEYKHTSMFRNIIDLLDKSNNTFAMKSKFSPLIAINKGYLNPDKFLFDKMDLKRFSVFIGVNENSAHKLFNKLITRLDNSTSVELTNTESEMIIKALKSIIRDEERHSRLAFSYSKTTVNMPSFIIFKILENVKSKVRTFYASQAKLSRLVATLIYTLVIAIIYPMKFAIILPEKNSIDLLKSERENLMI